MLFNFSLILDIRGGLCYQQDGGYLPSPQPESVREPGGTSMANKDDDLTLEGLARALRDHMNASAAEFEKVRVQFVQIGVQIDELRGGIGTVATVVRDLTQVVARHHDELAEHRSQLDEQRQQTEEFRQYVRQMFSRMEQHDARFEAMTRDIRRILDALERRGGDGGRRET